MSEEEKVFHCSFCGKTQLEVDRLITANDVFICNECTRRYEEKVDKYLRRKQKRCSFCGKKEEKVKKIIANPSKNVYICNECLELCVEIIEEEQNTLKICDKETKN